MTSWIRAWGCNTNIHHYIIVATAVYAGYYRRTQLWAENLKLCKIQRKSHKQACDWHVITKISKWNKLEHVNHIIIKCKSTKENMDYWEYSYIFFFSGNSYIFSSKLEVNYWPISQLNGLIAVMSIENKVGEMT